jgi:hypothetical protein
MNRRIIVEEINEILERIDQKITETQQVPITARKRAKPSVIKSMLSSASSLNDLLKRQSPSKPKHLSSSQGTSSTSGSKDLPFQPLLCKNSLKILKNSKTKEKKSKPLSRVDTFSYTFQPKTLENSSKILEKSKKVRNTAWIDLYQLSLNKNKVKEEVIIETNESIFNEFSFKPKNHSNPRTFERNSEWQKGRNEKVMIMAEKKHLNEYKECTFAPKVFLRDFEESEVDLYEISGVNQFVDRIRSCAKREEGSLERTTVKKYRDISQVEFSKARKELKDYLHSFTIN